MDPWSFLLSGTVFLGLFLTATTIAGAGHRAPRTWLSALLLSVSVFLLEFLLLESGFYGLPVVFLTYPLTFLMGPSLWLLAPSVLGEEPVTLRDALHGLPVLVGAVNQIPYYYDALTVGARGLAPRLLVPLGGYEMMTLHLMQLGVYVLLAARLLRRRARMQRDVDSGPIVERAQWIARLAAGLATIIVIQLLGTVAMSLTTHIHRHEFVTALTIGAFILFIGWTMSMNPRLLTPVQEPAARYARGPLSDDRIDSYRDRLLEVFARERPYLEPDLTLEGLARMTGIPHRHLSQVLSRGMGTTFFDLVNRHRVRHAAELLLQPEDGTGKMLTIAFDSGFASKATFNRVFKAHVGMTPSQFRTEAERDHPILTSPDRWDVATNPA